MRTSVLVAALSGAATLVFENLWFQSASIALGSSAWSSAVVLSAFMAGLALGSVGWLWFEPRIRNPLWAYASIELAIGLTGLTTLLVLPQVSTWLAPTFSAMSGSPWAVNALRFAVSFLLLVAPAAAMGATLPVLMQVVSGSAEAFGGKLGRIYGANTLGAVVGTLACELVLVPTVGMLATGLAAASLNGVAATLAWRAATTTSTADRKPRRVKPLPVREREPAIGLAPLLAAALVSGALFLGFEVAIVRFLLLFFTALNVNLAVMLAVVLGGVALGGFSGTWWFARYPRLGSALPAAACAAGIALVLAYRLFPFALGYALSLSPLAAIVVATTALAVPLSVLSGFLFAALGHAVHHTGLRDSAATGLVTAANTVGAAIGALSTGAFLIERLGVERLFLAFAVGYAVLAVLVFLATPRPVRSMGRPIWLATGAFIAALILFPTGLMDRVFHAFPINRLSEAGERRVAFKEGRLETIQYLRADSLGRPDYYRLITNNHSMSATDLRSRRYMRLFAHLPSILHPAPRTAALLGVGLGVTVKALTEDARFESIDVVDISPDIPTMLPVVYPTPADNPLRDPRVRLHVEDGRFFLATTGERFDVITAEPPPPHYAGVANLYSREFFQLLADRLKPGGIATYWLPVHDLKVDEARAILSAFLEAFPETSLWTGSGLDWIMMGLKPPGGGVTDAAFRAWWTDSPLSGRLREIGLDNPASLGALFIADGQRLRAWVEDVPPLTDNFPRRTSVDRPRESSDSSAFVTFMTASERPVNFVASPLIGSLWPDPLRTESLNSFKRQALVDAILSLPVLGVDDLQRLLADNPRDPLLVKALFWRHYVDFDRTRVVLDHEPTLEGPGVAEYRAQLAMMNGNLHEAADWLSRSTSPRARELVSIQAYCLTVAGDKAAADQLLRRGADR